MNAMRWALAGIVLLGSTSALAAPASERSVRQLLEVMEARKLVDGMSTQLDTVMDHAVERALRGSVPSDAQQAAIDRMKSRMVALEKGQLAWSKLEPMYVRLYQDAFTEEEVAALESFYRTPAGQALIHKMPSLMQKTMLEVQRMVADMTPQMQQIMRDFLTDMKAASPATR
ncbi:MAG: DUF2059 domain-containing protein [Burkholderiales bacterium]